METISKNRGQIWLAITVIFLLGFVAGALTLNLYYQNRSSATARGKRHGFDQIVTRLNLREDQKPQVEKILNEARTQFRGIRKESEPRFDELRAKVRVQLQAVLTLEQWQQFEQMMEQKRSRHRDKKNMRDHDDE